MNAKMNIQSWSVLISVIGLALLLLISPCKVRNFIQAELGLPQTEVSNKSKVTPAGTSCTALEIADSALPTSVSSLQIVPACAIKPITVALEAIDLSQKSIHSHPLRSRSVSFVPLFILYQNIKVYA